MTTEQALRKLRILGLTKDDEPIARALDYMEQNLRQPFPTVFHEKKHDSKIYGDLMLAAWIKLFDPQNETALIVVKNEHISFAPRFKAGCIRMGTMFQLMERNLGNSTLKQTALPILLCFINYHCCQDCWKKRLRARCWIMFYNINVAWLIYTTKP